MAHLKSFVAVLMLILAKFYQDGVREQYEQVLKDLNQTKTNQDILVFARVPKTASLALNGLLSRLKEVNQFEVLSNVDGMRYAGPNEEYLFEPDLQHRQRNMLAILNVTDKPFIYTRHQAFWDFSELANLRHSQQPLYFSFVRHPVDRVISWYYYLRSPSYQLSEDNQRVESVISIRALKESFEDCVAKGRSECQFLQGYSFYTPRHCYHSIQLPVFFYYFFL